MRIRTWLSVVVSLFFATSVALADHVNVDYDRGVNFSKFRTFIWVEKPVTDSPFMSDRIVEAVNGQLLAKGLEPVDSDADLCIEAKSSLQQRVEYTTYYNSWGGWGWGPGWGEPGWWYGWGGPGWATTYADTYTEGNVTVDLIDRATGKVVWRGVFEDKVSSKPEKQWKKMAKAISKMFEDYPGTRGRIS
jgi:hypothetical protein